MKKFLFTLALFLFLVTSSYSQMNTGSLFASGTTRLGFSSYTNKDIDSDYKTKTSQISFNPRVGYFVKNRIGAGGMMSLSHYKNKNDNDESNTNTSFLIGPFARYYVEYGSLIPFAEAGFGLGSNKSVSEYEGTYKQTHSQTRVNLGVGADFFLNDYCAIEGMLEYFWLKQKPTSDNATGSGNTQSGLVFDFGLTIFFGSI
jgi:hypothetical protein